MADCVEHAVEIQAEECAVWMKNDPNFCVEVLLWLAENLGHNGRDHILAGIDIDDTATAGDLCGFLRTMVSGAEDAMRREEC